MLSPTARVPPTRFSNALLHALSPLQRTSPTHSPRAPRPPGRVATPRPDFLQGHGCPWSSTRRRVANLMRWDARGRLRSQHANCPDRRPRYKRPRSKLENPQASFEPWFARASAPTPTPTPIPSSSVRDHFRARLAPSHRATAAAGLATRLVVLSVSDRTTGFVAQGHTSSHCQATSSIVADTLLTTYHRRQYYGTRMNIVSLPYTI